jgi:hypothetical protein
LKPIHGGSSPERIIIDINYIIIYLVLTQQPEANCDVLTKNTVNFRRVR